MQDERILLLQLKRIGDALLTAPAVSAVRQAFPKASLTLALSGATAQLGSAFCDVDEILTYRPGKLNLNVWSRLATGRFDSCLDFSGSDRTALMTRLSGARRRIGYRKFAEGKRGRQAAYTALCDASVRDLHTVDFHLALAKMITASDFTPNRSGFTIPASSQAAAEAVTAVGERYAVVHPGTARTEKYWPPERWAEVIAHLQHAHQLRCVLTGNPNDAEEAAHLRKIEALAGPDLHSVAGKLSLMDVAAVIGGSTLALGVDSAAMHLAAMLERPQIVLFGPTNPFHWRPRHENASVLLAGNESLNVNTFQTKHRPAPMTDLSTNQVCRAIDARLTAV
ncbi:MAG: glycosyltransferase family 9 protein [Verrucomicrobiales bacterium]